MATNYPEGIDSPLVRMMLMSSGQQGAVNTPVSSMGIGVQSNAQRASAGNKFESTTERLVKELARRKVELATNKKKKAKNYVAAAKGKGRDNGNTNPSQPVQLPTAAEPQGLEHNPQYNAY